MNHFSFTTTRCLLAFCTLLALGAGACGDDDDSTKPDASAGNKKDAATSDEDASTGGKSDASTSGSNDASTGDAAPGDAATGDGGVAMMCTGSCECTQGEVCDFECSGSDCNVMCLGGQCAAECAEGGCTLDADIGARATYSCDGGGCSVDCDVGSDCLLECAGGGCNVTCDEDSVCTVECGKGDPCTVTCENGGRGICIGDNCTAENCDTVCEPDPSYMPEINPADFTTTVDNPLLPWPIGAVFHSEGGGEVITVTVTDMQKTINGVDVVVVHDEVHNPEGDLIEDTLDYYAQDKAGNVWYFGEDTAEYVNGKVATTAGSWLYGKDGALPGIVMEAKPKAGDKYKQEYYACEAEDLGEVVEVGVSLKDTPTGDYDDCVTTRDTSPLEPSANELKTFCPGAGVVRVVDVALGGEVVEELKSVMLP